MKIANIVSQSMYDTAGWPTLKVSIILEDETMFGAYAPLSWKACIPNLSVLNNDEQFELKLKYVEQLALFIEEELRPLLTGKMLQVPDLDYLMSDLELEKNQSMATAAMLAISTALYKACAYQERVELYELIAFLVSAETVTLPCPQCGIVATENGQNLFKNVLIAPVGAPTLKEALQSVCSVWHTLYTRIKHEALRHYTNQDGSLILPTFDEHQLLELTADVLKSKICSNESMCVLALDGGTDHVYDADAKGYLIHEKIVPATELINYYNELIQTYPIYSLENIFADPDYEDWKILTETLGNRIQIIKHLESFTEQEIHEHALKNMATTLAINLHQFKTVTECLQGVLNAKKAKFNVIIIDDHNSTDDSFAVDLAVGTSALQIKFGTLGKTCLSLQYNRLLTIEETLRQTMTF
jgi:enolase